MGKVINIRECPEWLDSAADYFSVKWNIDKQLYIGSMNDRLSTKNTVPRWYLMLRDVEIIGLTLLALWRCRKAATRRGI